MKFKAAKFKQKGGFRLMLDYCFRLSNTSQTVYISGTMNTVMNWTVVKILCTSLHFTLPTYGKISLGKNIPSKVATC